MEKMIKIDMLMLIDDAHVIEIVKENVHLVNEDEVGREIEKIRKEAVHVNDEKVVQKNVEDEANPEKENNVADHVTNVEEHVHQVIERKVVLVIVKEVDQKIEGKTRKKNIL